MRFLIESEEFKDNRILSISSGFSMMFPICARSFYSLFIPAQGEPFIDPGVELPFKLGKRPLVLSGFDLIKPALSLVVNIHEEDVMRPAESKGVGELCRHRLHNWCFPMWLSGQFPRHCLGNLRYRFMTVEVKPAHVLKICC